MAQQRLPRGNAEAQGRRQWRPCSTSTSNRGSFRPQATLDSALNWNREGHGMDNGAYRRGIGPEHDARGFLAANPSLGESFKFSEREGFVGVAMPEDGRWQVFLCPHIPARVGPFITNSRWIRSSGAVLSSCYRARIRGRRRTWPVGPTASATEHQASAWVRGAASGTRTSVHVRAWGVIGPRRESSEWTEWAFRVHTCFLIFLLLLFFSSQSLCFQIWNFKCYGEVYSWTKNICSQSIILKYNYLIKLLYIYIFIYLFHMIFVCFSS
jgi:hypothetical protein